MPQESSNKAGTDLIMYGFPGFPSTSPAVGILRKYRMNTTGPQCPGLLGDFVYLSPGLELTVKKLQDPWTGTSPPKFWR